MRVTTWMNFIIPVNMRKLFYPFVGVMTGLIVVYSFLNWLFIVRTGQFVFNLVWIETWIPAVISAVIVRWWVVPKLRHVNFIVDRCKNYVLMFAFFILVVTLHFAQIWVEIYYAKMQHLNRMSEVSIEPKKRFYDITQGYHIEKNSMSYYDYEYDCGGRHRVYCSEIYVVYPIHEKKNEVIFHTEPISWLGVLFKNKVTTRSSRDEFVIQTMQYLEKLDPNTFYYLERRTNSNMILGESSKRFQIAINNGRYAFPISENPLILLADYHPFSERVRDNGENAVGIWIFAVLAWFGVVYMLIGERY